MQSQGGITYLKQLIEDTLSRIPHIDDRTEPPVCGSMNHKCTPVNIEATSAKTVGRWGVKQRHTFARHAFKVGIIRVTGSVFHMIEDKSLVTVGILQS